ncbi:MAG: hypothetical protein LBV17_10315 [Treponema sp.]|jgi:hypothetical protein|nr:hypothetical protein [Treponema sp.]
MKRRFALLVLFTFAVSCVFSIPLEELTGAENAARLRSGSVSETQLGKPVLKLLPVLPELRQIAADSMSSLEPTVTVETLYLYKKQDSSSAWNDTRRAALFNQMLAISTLTGIEYFSASRNKMRTFYEYSAVIDDPSTKKPLSDPVFEQPPAKYTLYARQKDLTFGDNIYRYDYTAAKDALFFIQENITPLNYGIITAVGKNRLKSVLAVVDCGDFLLIYAVSMAKAVSLPGMTDRIGNSFRNRADAVYKWFVSGADKVF